MEVASKAMFLVYGVGATTAGLALLGAIAGILIEGRMFRLSALMNIGACMVSIHILMMKLLDSTKLIALTSSLSFP